MLLAGVLSIPAGWFALVLIERGPGDQPFLRPVRGFARSGREVTVQVFVTVGCVAMAMRFGSAPLAMMIAMIALITVLIALSIIDMATYRLPDRIVLPALCGSIVWMTAVSLIAGRPEDVRSALVGALAFFIVLFAAHLVSPRGMGFGDVKLAALMGLFLGWATDTVLDAVVLVLWAMLIGFAIGTVAGFVILLRRRSNQPFPFGPFLAAGTVLALLASSLILG